MNNTKITLVTGIWDLNRQNATEGWSRSFDHYVSHFINLLSNIKDINLIIFIDPSLEDLVWQHRSKTNTRVYHHPKEKFGGWSNNS